MNKDFIWHFCHYGRISNYQKFHEEAKKNPEEHIGNPLNAYLLIKRLTVDWKRVKKLMKSKSRQKCISNMANKTKHFMLTWPTDKDLPSAAKALVKLQDVYRLSPEEMSEGRLQGKSSNALLLAEDCLEIANQSSNENKFKESLQWLDLAMKKMDEEGPNANIDIKDIYISYVLAYYYTGDLKKAIHYTKLFLKLKPKDPEALRNKEFLENKLKENHGNEEGKRSKVPE